MRLPLLTVLVAACAVLPAHGQDIADVLRQSQDKRLALLRPAPDGPRADTVRRSFDSVKAALQSDVPVDLHVITGPVVAETLHGHIIVANESLADVPEGQRLFILAHELGHVQNHHWLAMGRLYKRWVPGEVTPEKTDPIAGGLGRDASRLAHRQEFEADAVALRVLHGLGRSPQDAFSAFTMMGLQQDTATHPGTASAWRPCARPRPASTCQAVTRNELIEAVSRPD
jgi:hypothetical protein